MTEIDEINKNKSLWLPDFIIVGAMKAGTTTLMRYLVRNPQICIPDYEVHFFDDDKNYEKGLEWYSSHFSQSERIKAIGEKTPTYSYDPKVAERIYKALPDTKLVWLFRNPVDRTYSNYIHALLRGTEKFSFKEALKKEEERIEKNIFKGYKRRSIYAEQVERFLEYYPQEKMHFIIFENFIQNPDKELQRLFEFLEVGNNLKSEKSESIKANQSYVPFSVPLQYYSYKFWGDSLPHKVINYFNRLFSSTVPPLSDEIRSELETYFSEYNKQLSELINMKLDIWETQLNFEVKKYQ